MKIRPWPSRRDRKTAVDAACEEYVSTVREGHAVDAVVRKLKEARENNHFRERFEAALRGS